MNAYLNKEDDTDNNSISLRENGVNTDELDPEELRKLVENNIELQKNEVRNVREEVTKVRNKKRNTESIKSLTEKEHIIEILKSSNSELKEKISFSEYQYKDIFSKLKGRSNEEDISSLSLKVKEIEKEIMATNYSTDNYKKMIDTMKNKLEFKVNLERAINLETILKLETGKNKEIKKEYDSLSKVNDIQTKALSNYDKENRITEKIDLLKSEIKTIKDSIKDCQEKHTKQDKFIKSIHSKMTLFEMNLKKCSLPKIETKKNFTKEEFIQNLEILNHLKNDIKENRKRLGNLTRLNEEKLNTMINLNKKIELDFKENDKCNKMLIYKKNELRKLMRQSENKNMNKIYGPSSPTQNQFDNINKLEINSENLRPIKENQKLFSKNPNRKQYDNVQLKTQEDDREYINNTNDEDANVDNYDENIINHSDVENNDADSNFQDESQDEENEEAKISFIDSYREIENFNVELN